jgi:hypothetical protein
MTPVREDPPTKIPLKGKPPKASLNIQIPRVVASPKKGQTPRCQSGGPSPKAKKDKDPKDVGSFYEYVKRLNLRGHMTLIDSTVYSAPTNSILDEVKFRPDGKEILIRVVADPNYTGSGKKDPKEVDNWIYDVEKKTTTGKLLGDYSGLNERITHFEYGPNSNRLISIMNKKSYCWGVHALRPAHRDHNEYSQKSKNWVLNWSTSETGIDFNGCTAKNVKDLGKEYTKLFELNQVDMGKTRGSHKKD